MTNLDCILKSRAITLLIKVHLVKAMIFPVVVYGCVSWTIKKAECWRTDAFELWCWRRLESPLDCKEMKPVNPKGNQSWIFIGRTDAEAETPIHWPPDEKSWLIRKDSDAGKDWRQEEKGLTEDEIVGWHHWLKGHEFEQALGDGEEQGSSELWFIEPFKWKPLPQLAFAKWSETYDVGDSQRLCLRAIEVWQHLMCSVDTTRSFDSSYLENRQTKTWGLSISHFSFWLLPTFLNKFYRMLASSK